MIFLLWQVLSLLVFVSGCLFIGFWLGKKIKEQEFRPSTSTYEMGHSNFVEILSLAPPSNILATWWLGDDDFFSMLSSKPLPNTKNTYFTLACLVNNVMDFFFPQVLKLLPSLAFSWFVIKCVRIIFLHTLPLTHTHTHTHKQILTNRNQFQPNGRLALATKKCYPPVN